mmetsp:Transcript_147520/g.473921  ORF Transcript_147520/g.473921 Transcript_147520/m.473921 type:complete len:215 (+) Transcript_147520:1451-2095(+)
MLSSESSGSLANPSTSCTVPCTARVLRRMPPVLPRRCLPCGTSTATQSSLPAAMLARRTGRGCRTSTCFACATPMRSGITTPTRTNLMLRASSVILSPATDPSSSWASPWAASRRSATRTWRTPSRSSGHRRTLPARISGLASSRNAWLQHRDICKTMCIEHFVEAQGSSTTWPWRTTSSTLGFCHCPVARSSCTQRPAALRGSWRGMASWCRC